MHTGRRFYIYLKCFNYNWDGVYDISVLYLESDNRGAQDKVILAFVQINYSMINYLTDWESIIVLWQLGYH
jgi:hypothetical protein